MLVALAALGTSLSSFASRPDPGRPAPSTRPLTRQEPRDRIPWRRALVACALDPADPLRLKPAERGRLLPLVTEYVYARERLMFQQGRLHGILGTSWRRIPPDSAWTGVAPEDVALEELPAILRVLQARNPAPPTLVPYPGNLVEPHGFLGTHHPQPWDPGDARELDLGEILSLLRSEAGSVPPEDVPATAHAAAEIQRESERLRSFWLTMGGLARTRERQRTVRRTAAALPRDHESLDPLDEAMGYLFRNWDRVAAPR